MVKILSVSEVLDRQSKLILLAYNMSAATGIHPPPRRMFSGSGEPIVTAALGGSIQPMRGNVRGASVAAPFEPYVV